MDDVELAQGFELRTFMGTVIVRDGSDGMPPVVAGTAVVLRQRSENFGDDEFRLFEEIDERALDETDLSDVRALFNHNSSLILGRTVAQTLVLKRDTNGLHYEINLGDTSVAHDVRKHIQRGDVTGSSFAFNVPRGGAEMRELEGGVVLRTIKRIGKIVDVGPVTFPAYAGTTTNARGLDVVRRDAQTYLAGRKAGELEDRRVHEVDTSLRAQRDMQMARAAMTVRRIR